MHAEYAPMEVHESLSSETRFEGNDIQRKHCCAESMINELAFDASALDAEIEMALRRARLDPRNYAHQSYAKAIVHRRDNLLRTIENLKQHHKAET
jgi:hypothetical protein